MKTSNSNRTEEGKSLTIKVVMRVIYHEFECIYFWWKYFWYQDFWSSIGYCHVLSDLRKLYFKFSVYITKYMCRIERWENTVVETNLRSILFKQFCFRFGNCFIRQYIISIDWRNIFTKHVSIQAFTVVKVNILRHFCIFLSLTILHMYLVIVHMRASSQWDCKTVRGENFM